MNAFRWILLAACLLAVWGCSYVTTTTTPFYDDSFSLSGKLVVMPADPAQQASLEFRHYQQQFEQKLAEQGFEITSSLEDADYAALIAYGVDEGQSRLVSSPIIGQTGANVYYATESVHNADGEVTQVATRYAVPVYGVVGNSVSSVTSYTKVIALDILQAGSLASQQPVKVYEGRAYSTDHCNVIASVFTPMLDALFQEFPGISGQPYRVEIRTRNGC